MRGAGPITAMSISGEDLSFKQLCQLDVGNLQGKGVVVVVTLFCDRVV